METNLFMITIFYFGMNGGEFVTKRHLCKTQEQVDEWKKNNPISDKEKHFKVEVVSATL